MHNIQYPAITSVPRLFSMHPGPMGSSPIATTCHHETIQILTEKSDVFMHDIQYPALTYVPCLFNMHPESVGSYPIATTCHHDIHYPAITSEAINPSEEGLHQACP